MLGHLTLSYGEGMLPPSTEALLGTHFVAFLVDCT